MNDLNSARHQLDTQTHNPGRETDAQTTHDVNAKRTAGARAKRNAARQQGTISNTSAETMMTKPKPYKKLAFFVRAMVRGFLLLAVTSAAPVSTSEERTCLRLDAVSTAVAQRQAKVFAAMHSPGQVECSVDLTATIKPCHQATMSWCWATSIAGLGFFYNRTAQTADCAATECSVVSADLKLDCCPAGSSAACDRHGARTMDEVATVANAFIPGHNFSAINKPLDEPTLAAVLSAGKPIVMGMQWKGSSGGHAMVLGGCRKGAFNTAEYAVHDPESKSWSWYGYENVLNHGLLTWVSAVYDGAAVKVQGASAN